MASLPLAHSRIEFALASTWGTRHLNLSRELYSILTLTAIYRPFAACCCIVPISVVIICATWSMSTGLAPRCVPLLDGCVSISGSVRSVPVIYLFRSVMLPMSVVLFVFWWLNGILLSQCLEARHTLRRWILCLSLTGTAFLPLYVVFLGTDGPVYDFLRRLGIYVFFGATGVAQLLTTFALRSLMQYDDQPLLTSQTTQLAFQLQWLIVLFMLLAGPLNLVLKQILQEPGYIENIIEWNFGLLMFCWYGLQSFTMPFRQRSA